MYRTGTRRLSEPLLSKTSILYVRRVDGRRRQRPFKRRGAGEAACGADVGGPGVVCCLSRGCRRGSGVCSVFGSGNARAASLCCCGGQAEATSVAIVSGVRKACLSLFCRKTSVLYVRRGDGRRRQRPFERRGWRQAAANKVLAAKRKLAAPAAGWPEAGREWPRLGRAGRPGRELGRGPGSLTAEQDRARQ